MDEDARGMTKQERKTWFITGVSSGLGRELARAVRRSGDRVIGTVRKAAHVDELAAEGIDALILDVDDEASVQRGVSEATARLGRIDVLVNNAGFGMAGAVEALSIEEVRAVMETNFFGALRVTQALIPSMRATGGTIVMVTSMAGVVGFAGTGAYCASKFALEGLSEALADELVPFGVHVLIVEPGSFRTAFAGDSNRRASRSIDAYAGTQAGEAHRMMAAYAGTEPGDPAKGADAIIATVRSPSPPRRLVLGADAVELISAKLDQVRQDIGAWREVSRATAFS